MKTPGEVAARLARQWQNNKLRGRRLLDASSWPLRIPLPKPSPAAVADRWTEVGAGLEAWRAVTVGEVSWVDVSYRATGRPIPVPAVWSLQSAEEWVTVCELASDDGRDGGLAPVGVSVRAEFEGLRALLAVAEPRYHELLVRRRALSLGADRSEVTEALRVAEVVWPGCAGGLPLRALSLAGVDTKFFERNRALVSALLDVRFDGAVSELGLEVFLGATGPGGRWLLAADLDGSLLPFDRLRVTDVDLAERGLVTRRLLVVENEQCLHLVPAVPGTVAVLGTGHNVGWLASSRFDGIDVAYWGDLDTWGLRLLAAARAARPSLTALLMDASTFVAHEDRAVVEPTPAEVPVEAPGRAGLTAAERDLFDLLAGRDRGRLEQELLPGPVVARAVRAWADGTSAGAVAGA